MAFDPTTLFPGAAGDRQGAILKIRPENLWQNAAGTTPVTADGQSVVRIDDISVNGRDFILNSSDSPPVYRTNGTVHWLEFTGGGVLDNTEDWSVMNGNPYSVGAAIEFTGAFDEQYFFGTDTAGGGNDTDSVAHVGIRDTDEYTIAHWFNDHNITRTTTAGPERHIAEYHDPGCEYFIDNSSIGGSATVPSALDEVGKVTIGGREQFSAFGTYDLFGIIIIIDTITSQERADIDEWLQEQIEGEPTEQTVNVGLASETSTANAVPGAKVHTSGQAAETSSATAVGAAKATTVGQASETDVAAVVGSARAVTVNQASETSSATAILLSITMLTGQATETAEATAVGRSRAFTTGQATETNAAVAVEVSRTELALQAVEENNATAVTISRAWAVGRATETSTATGVAASGALNIGLSAETDAAQPVGHFRVATLGLGTVTDAAQPVAHSRATLVGQAGETNAASSLGHSRLAVVGVALESDTAPSVTETGGAEPEPGAGDFWILRRRRRWV